MKQYCRYCANAVLTDEELIYCISKRETRDKNSCVTTNKCKRFEFNELDVFDIDKKYEQRKIKKSLGTQTKMEVQ